MISYLISNRKVFITVLIAILCISFRERLEILFDSVYISQDGNEILFTTEQLAQYKGISQEKLYLALMGSIFDVTKGVKHYGPGAPYNYFVGKDGSRAFISGNFKDESEHKDHILDFPCSDLFILTNWRQTLSEKYELIGQLIGRYYNVDGEKTEYGIQVQERLERCKQEREAEKLEDQKFPPCNVEWSVDLGTKVWCSKTSGGVKRPWVGVPRQLYSPGQEHPRCVCVKSDEDITLGLLKEYEGCLHTSTQCTVRSNG